MLLVIDCAKVKQESCPKVDEGLVSATGMALGERKFVN